MQLSVLESRLIHKLPEKHHETVEKEFERFETESSRISEEPESYGQATLTDREINKANTTNQHGETGHTVIELQYIKAVALKNGVRDWLSYVDPELTYEENALLIENKANPTFKDIPQRF